MKRRSGRRKKRPDLLDWVLAFFYASEGVVPSREHLEKALFIASKHLRGLAELLGREKARGGVNG